MLQETIVNKAQLLKALDALIELIDDWNDLAADEDQGRSNDALILTLADDGSGYLANGWPTSDYINKQCSFSNPTELVNYLADWLKFDERDLEAALQESHAEVERLRSILDEADERAKIIEERLDNVIAGNRQLIAELDSQHASSEQWQDEYRMYANAWSRELGPLKPKTHLIDSLVLTTREMVAELNEWRAGHRRLGVGTVVSISDDELPPPPPASKAF